MFAVDGMMRSPVGTLSPFSTFPTRTVAVAVTFDTVAFTEVSPALTGDSSTVFPALTIFAIPSLSRVHVIPERTDCVMSLPFWSYTVAVICSGAPP